MQTDYIDRVYSGWLGKTIGVRFGAPIEGWSYEKIEEEIGEIIGYIQDFKMFAADDDTNGPVAFIRALEDYGVNPSYEEMGKTWLNYIADTHGMLWWGGYGVSTEHTAYLNLQNGLKAPLSGSIQLNGLSVAEQIGGQIFIDIWGLICPGNPELAAVYAEKAASVSHDGNGKYGGMFIAACIAEAFKTENMKEIINTGLSQIPENCEYTRVVNEVLKFYDEDPIHWRECFKFIKSNFGYDKYPGACHIIPNSAVMVLSLLYGEGDFDKTVKICNMCGWDTDCNVGNVACIMGVRNGLKGISDYWRKPINDVFVSSTVIGDLNIVDIPLFAKYIARFGYEIAGENIPQGLEDTGFKGEVYKFDLEGSTHGFNVNCENVHLKNVVDKAVSNKRMLRLECNNVHNVQVYRKTNYRPEDFDDDRYCPDFSPILYPGYAIAASVYTTLSEVSCSIYVKDGNADKRIYGEKVKLIKDTLNDITFEIPYLEGVCIDELGIDFSSDETINGSIFINWICYKATPNYLLDFSKEKMEKWSLIRKTPSQLTMMRGLWELYQGKLRGSGFGNCESYTGSRKWCDYEIESIITPIYGKEHNINFRIWGGMKSYAAGLSENNCITLYKNIDGKYTKLISKPFEWEFNKSYKIKVNALKNVFTVYLEDREFMKYTDDDNCYYEGQVGFSNLNGAHTQYNYLKVKSI